MTAYSQKTFFSAINGSTDILLLLKRNLIFFLQKQILKRQIEHERRQLKELPAELLVDIGLDFFSAQQEACRIDIPENRKIWARLSR